MTNPDDIVEDLVLSDSTEHVVLNAALDRIDLGKWLTALTDAEYQACAVPDHKACGWSRNADGDLVSINVEVVGGTLLIQHYVAEILEPHHCRLVSLTESQTPDGWQHIQVIWDLSVAPLGFGQVTFTNRVVSHPTRSFLEYLAERGIPFEQAVAARKAAVARHNAIEAPNYGASIERAAQGT